MGDPAFREPREPDLSPDVVLSELHNRARDRQSDIMDCLGQKARRNPNAALELVILAAARYRRLGPLYDDAPRRSVLHDRLMVLRSAVRTASELLSSGDTWLFAALSVGGLSEKEARGLNSGSVSKIQTTLGDLRHAAEAALKTLQLSGAAGGQKPMRGPKQLLALDCAVIFEKYRPGEIEKPKGRGPGFRPFVQIVGEVATGDEWPSVRTAIRDARAAVRAGRAIPPTSISPTDAFDPLCYFRNQLKGLASQGC